MAWPDFGVVATVSALTVVPSMLFADALLEAERKKVVRFVVSMIELPKLTRARRRAAADRPQ